MWKMSNTTAKQIKSIWHSHCWNKYIYTKCINYVIIFLSRFQNYPSKMYTCKEHSLLMYKSNTVRNVSSLSTEPWGTPYTAVFLPGSSGSWCRAGEPAVERFPEMSPVDGACWHRHTRTSWPSRSVAGSPFACGSGCRDTLFWCTCRGADAETKERRDSMKLE